MTSLYTNVDHDTDTLAGILALCVGKIPVTGDAQHEGPVIQNFDDFFDVNWNKLLNKQSCGLWNEIWQYQVPYTHLCIQAEVMPTDISLKTKYRQSDNFVITGGTVSCHYENLRCHQWWWSCQIDNLLFSMYMYDGGKNQKV